MTPVLRRALIAVVWLATLGSAFVAGAFAHKYRAQIRAKLRALQGASVIYTSLYNLRVQKLAFPGEGRDGSIAALGDGLLAVNRFGRAWYVDAERRLHPLPLVVPVNYADFDADPYNARTTDRDRFSVKDIIIQPLRDSVRVLASYTFWYPDRDCYTLRVSALETTAEALRSGGAGADAPWRTVFESTPCRELVQAEDGTRHPTLGAGGRLAALTERQVLVTVGEFTAEYTPPPSETPGAVDSYGKTVLIDVVTGTSRPWTSGHRNAQGLTVGPDGRVWLTEHGPRGGDELNLLTEGRNYGSPYVTYGTQYEMLTWPYSTLQGRHEGFEKPLFAWVPSIGISEVVVAGARIFPWWAGDLLVTSLGAQTLYRVRVEEGRVILVEPIFVAHRIRDIAELASGALVLKTDDNFLVFLDNLDAAGSENLEPAVRGAVLAAQCRSCHTLEEGGEGGIGPNLWGIVGRRVASQRRFAYSEALRRVGGSWSEESLKRFLADPGAFAPGTGMAIMTRYSDAELDALVAYLGTLR
jgi:cytochrome c2